MTVQGRPIMVGYDGSAPSVRALAWALREARERHLAVTLVHCYEPVMASLALGYGAVVPQSLLDDIHAQARHVVAQGVAEAEAMAPDVAVDGSLLPGSAPSAILAVAPQADMLVLGSRGLGGFKGLLLGSVSHQVGVHSHVPVVVVRGDHEELDDSGPVVVGLDGSPASTSALGFAFEFAARHQRHLIAVHAWELPVYDAPGVTVPPSIALEEIEDDELRVTAESLAGWREKYPDVTVISRVVHGPAERVMVESSRGASLLVVGSRGRGGFRGLLLGSVGLAALHHSHCPVAVVRPD